VDAGSHCGVGDGAVDEFGEGVARGPLVGAEEVQLGGGVLGGDAGEGVDEGVLAFELFEAAGADDARGVWRSRQRSVMKADMVRLGAVRTSA
jgi:hypothetical protein